MRNIIKTVFSIFVALTMSSPIEALSNPTFELKDIAEDEEANFVEADTEGYTIMFHRSDLGLSFDRRDISDQVGSLMMFMTNTDKKIVKDAQVVVTLISQTGEQTMSRARPYKGGYIILTDNLDPGHYRLELEAIVDGWLLTDQVYFDHA